LRPGEAHVWFARSDEVRDADTLACYAAMMSPAEMARHDRFVFDRSRHQFLVTRGMIRSLVARYLDVDPAACAFEIAPYGRPFLSNPLDPGFSFNISHTAGMVACAIAAEPEIGIDVEETGRARSVDLPRRFFSQDEADALDALPDSERQLRFYEYWTLKEAYIKARGLGLALPLNGFTMLLDGAAPPRIRFAPSIAEDPDTWQFAQFTPTPRHQLAVAIRRGAGDWHIGLREFVPPHGG
jgi:4'-phosphopantetheinyl transferase